MLLRRGFFWKAVLRRSPETSTLKLQNGPVNKCYHFKLCWKCIPELYSSSKGI